MDDGAMPVVSQSPPLVCNIDSTIENHSFSPKIVEDTIPPCDIIFFKSGKIEYCKIIEANPTTITYKMCDYLNGPNIIVNKTSVHKIRYANGREEVVVPEASGQKNMNAHVKARKDPLATWSLIFGITGMTLIVLWGAIIPVLGIAGLTFGIISLVKIHKRNGELRGKGTAIWGIVLCGLILLILLASI
jgi:hypothetical protein